MLDHSNEEQEQLPHLDQEWLTSKETISRQEQHINDKEMRRVQSKQRAIEQEIQQAEQGCKKQVTDNDTGIEDNIHQS